MQGPPIGPGMKLRKFHFVLAAASTSIVSMPSSWKIADIDVEIALRKSRS